MLKKFEKLELKLNAGLVSLMAWLKLIIPKITPNFIKRLLVFLGEKIRTAIFTVYEFFRNIAFNLTMNAAQFLAWLKTRKQPLLEKWGETKEKLTTIKKFFKGTPLKSSAQYIKQQSKKTGLKLNKKLKNISREQVTLGGIALVMLTLGTYGVYFSSQSIWQKEFPYREPASVQEYDEKPEYFYLKEQTVLFQNIKVPLQVLKVGDMESLTIDFSVRTSTRFARYYLSENEHKLKDYFFTNVEPIVSNHVLEVEAKEVLKEKIKSEVQQFLNQEKVEGQVLEINIHYIVGS